MGAIYVPETAADIGAAALQHAHQAGIEGDPVVTDNGDGSISVASGQANFWSDATRETIVHLVLPAAVNLTPAKDVTNYLCADRDTLTWVLRSDFDTFRYLPYAILFERTGSNGEHLQHIPLKAHGEVESIYMRTFETARYARAYGLDQVSVDINLHVTSDAGRVYSVNHPYDLEGIAADFRQFWCTQAGVYSSSTGPTIDNTQYDDGTQLLPLDPDYWVNIFCFLGVEEQRHCYFLRSGQFASVEEAKASNAIGTIPDLISSHAILISRITVQQGSAVELANIDSAFTSTFSTASSVGDPNRNRKITFGTADPSGGASGDVYIKYDVPMSEPVLTTATADTAPLDTDELISLRSGTLRTTWANVKTFLSLTYFRLAQLIDTSATTNLLINPATKASGNLADFQVGGASKASISNTGQINTASGYSFAGASLLTSSGSDRILRAPTAGGIVLRTNSTTDAVNVQSAGDIKLNFGISKAITTTATNLTLTAAHHTVIVTADATITLPAAASHTGRVYVIKKTYLAGTGVVIDGNASETIDGALTYTLYTQYESITVQSNGTEWFIL